MKSFHIHIRGRIQGLGFRPFIYNLSVAQGLNGTVVNTSDGVHIEVNSLEEGLNHYIESIRSKAPPLSLITSLEHTEIPFRDYHNFSILKSDTSSKPDMLISPDFAICDTCKAELAEPHNPRFHYPFITCTTCGPRFSIIENLPYDRQRTSMKTFHMCMDCQHEYKTASDKRFHSQTNSCPRCKIRQWVVDAQGMQIELEDDRLVDFVCDKIRDGAIVAVKGIGGYLLICDASRQEAVVKLRIKKHRTTKPFALMYPSLEMVEQNYIISRKEREALSGIVAPIVLINSTKDVDTNLQEAMAPNLDSLGIMLPYAPILVLIANNLDRPLLATSANLKGSPVIYRNENAVHSLGQFADFILLNNRDIMIPQDDSLIKFTPKHQHKITIRRSRGLAPGFYTNFADGDFDLNVLSMGALLKSTFGIWQHGRCHISQYLGDTSGFDAQLSYDNTLHHFMDLLQLKPDMVVVDKHPTYFTTQGGKELVSRLQVPLLEVQHHEAHLWAVLGENDLLNSHDRILGVIFDGTGMGHDGAVWGGEFYCVQNYQAAHVGQMKYFTHILGDKMAREPRLSAMSLLNATDQGYHLVRDFFSNEELDFYDKVIERSSLQTSSIGRLCDAVASLLGLCQINSYEGEAAMYLESSAQKYCHLAGRFPDPYPIACDQFAIYHGPVFLSVIKDIKRGKSIGEIAARFHRTLVEIIVKMAENEKVNALAFSGGVFQNSLLVDMLIEIMGTRYKLFFHKELSPNDECISYGQLVACYVDQKLKTTQQNVQSQNSEKPCA